MVNGGGGWCVVRGGGVQSHFHVKPNLGRPGLWLSQGCGKFFFIKRRLIYLIASCGLCSMLDPLGMCLIGLGGSGLLSLFLISSLARILLIGGSSSLLLTSCLVNFLGLILAADKVRQKNNIRRVLLPGMLCVPPCVFLDYFLTGKQSYKVSKLSLTAAAWAPVERVSIIFEGYEGTQGLCVSIMWLLHGYHRHVVRGCTYGILPTLLLGHNRV